MTNNQSDVIITIGKNDDYIVLYGQKDVAKILKVSTASVIINNNVHCITVRIIQWIFSRLR